MTKEELKQEAEEKAGIYFDSLDYDHGNVSDTPFSAYDVFTAYEKGAMDFAEPREKRIEELEDKLSRVKNILLSYIEWEDAVTESKVYVYEDIFVNAIKEIEK